MGFVSCDMWNVVTNASVAIKTVAISISIISLFWILPSYGTSTYSYRKHEYVTVKDGLAPNKRFSVAAHGEGDYGEDNFHLYLMAEPKHEKLGPLDGIGPEFVDTGPDAYQAEWSTNSRYVTVYYRADRHYTVVRLYKIENQRVYWVRGPKLLDVAADSTSDIRVLGDSGSRIGGIELTWVSRNRFILKEWRVFPYGNSKLAAMLGKFGKAEPFSGNENAQQYHPIYFSADAICELISGHRYRIVRIRPSHQMKFWDYWRQ